MMARPIPPRMSSDASRRRNVIDSLKNNMPPTAASTGTLSCTVAAVVAFSPGRALYQIT